MNIMAILEKLATTPHHQHTPSEWLSLQPAAIKSAFMTNNAALLKRQLGSDRLSGRSSNSSKFVALSMINASLVVVGCGIKFVAHLTMEARAYIEQTPRVLYLVNDPAMKDWLVTLNPQAESLDPLYSLHPLRQDNYRAITNYILAELQKQQHVCVVLYGHPSVFTAPGVAAVRAARAAGFDARILPGISAEACLYADLLIDPGEQGAQSFEATDFLLRQRPVIISSYLLLWQVDAIGLLDQSSTTQEHLGIQLLMDYLLQFYLPTHKLYIYEAAQYPGFSPRMDSIELSQLSSATLTRVSTLCLPPAQSLTADRTIGHALQCLS